MTCILYGSQTGQAKSIAENLFSNLKDYINNIKIFELDEIDQSFDIYNLKYAIIICSTTGDGDAPDNAAKFLRRIKLCPLNSLNNLNYTVLGLGDTNYSNFCNCGKTIDHILESLGAKKFYPSGMADDAVGLEIIVEPWIYGLYEMAKDIVTENTIYNFQKISLTEVVKTVTQSETSLNEVLGDHLANDLKDKNLTAPALQSSYLNFQYSDTSIVDFQKPLFTTMPLPSSNSDLIMGNIKKIEKITKKYAVKSVHRVSINIPCSEWKWKPGDSVGILPCNSESEVDAILSRLAVPESNRNCEVKIGLLPNLENRRAKIPEHLIVAENASLSLKSILMWLCDIRQPISKVGLRIMSDYCRTGSAEQRRLLELCSREGQSLYTKCLRETSMPVLDLLNWFPSCQLPVERLLEVLPRLKPRAYSLCDLKSISFAFSKVDIAPIQGFRKRPLTGVCTTWMEKMARTSIENIQEIPIYLRKNMNGFTVCDNPSMPHILIGPGTGVSPFLSFLQHFEYLKNKGENIGPIWLFFGCRNEERDFLFQEQLEYFYKIGILTHLCVCFSRDDSNKTSDIKKSFCCPPNCKYVQDCILFHSKTMTDLLINDGARIFVCGDSSGMSKDVLETWSKVLIGNHDTIQSKKDADSFITSMRVKKLYLEDVWL